jgi:hypothetical protein
MLSFIFNLKFAVYIENVLAYATHSKWERRVIICTQGITVHLLHVREYPYV